MKLIPLIVWTINLAVINKAHETFTFPPQFQGSPPGMFSPEKQFYLPPETHTVLPYYPMKKITNLQFPYLPSTVKKSPTGTSNPLPAVLATTVLPANADEDDDDDDEETPRTPSPPYLRYQYNRTRRDPTQKSDRQKKGLLHNYQYPIDRIDTKLPIQFNINPEPTTQNSGIQTMTPRSIIISDIQRDHNMDQIKSASVLGQQYVSQSGVYISTTETAIPILRLSNEMDLDGSFSYEALGADQTHYVQHSRIENTGSDKEEQVVEGSYSYVGDNGKTYTVHYIADSNGFRASGEHLPVPPPVPEIIQRSVQYNLAEELKKPALLKQWHEEEKENEVSESEKRNHYAISPSRFSNLFTGKTPESFSHSFSQSSNTQNNLVAAATSQTSIPTIDYLDQIQNKQNSPTISPQITFLASQGAHVPSVNVPQQQPSIGRIFTTERPALPLIVNYEANAHDTDQDSNKGLWRWQYGINANSNPNIQKNLISRSSTEDDISINFSDMTADQYTKMLQREMQPTMRQSSEIPQLQNFYNQENSYEGSNRFSNIEGANQYNGNNYNVGDVITNGNHYSTEKNRQEDESNKYFGKNKSESYSKVSQSSQPKLVTHNQVIPQSQIVTQSYNYDEIDYFEPRKTENNNKHHTDLNIIPLNAEKSIISKTAPMTSKIHTEKNILDSRETSTENVNKIKFTDFIQPQDSKNGFKPMFSRTDIEPTETITTTEMNAETMIKENIFLKNLFRNNKNDPAINNKISNENKNLQVVPMAEKKTDKYAIQNYNLDPKPYNKIKPSNRMPLNIADIMNYLSSNQFESTKVTSKPKQIHNNFKQNNDMHYFTTEDNREITEDKNTLQQKEELRGPIKNYKVLLRNNNIVNAERDDVDGLKTNLRPPPVKVFNLPPLGRAGPTVKPYLPPVYV